MLFSFRYWKWWVNARIIHPLQAAFSRTYTSSISGLPTKRCGYITVKGERRFCKIPFTNGQLPYTLDEIRGMTATCTWCGGPIFIGDPVTLYGIYNTHFKPPPEAVQYSTEPSLWVGCNRSCCTDTAVDVQGRWIPDDSTVGKGKVQRVPSVFELLLQNPGCGAQVIQDGNQVTMKLLK